MAVEENDHDRGAADVEALGDVEQDTAIAVGFVFPIDAAGAGAVAFAAGLVDIEKLGAGGGDTAPERKRRG